MLKRKGSSISSEPAHLSVIFRDLSSARRRWNLPCRFSRPPSLLGHSCSLLSSPQQSSGPGVNRHLTL
ncbi:hypothetical protein PVAP13_5KG395107 [Panicum virgatum]|uniref:Uncharacterized protein n=1 Tax=Panicum virgatum TaxID=38727 RepID=A0A8T0SR73_PANVG|nr:hypothetical protein PVAP13_5KG395107 [Panicum virgatum]